MGIQLEFAHYIDFSPVPSKPELRLASIKNRPLINLHANALHISLIASSVHQRNRNAFVNVPLRSCGSWSAPWSDDCKHTAGLVLKTRCAGRASAFSNGDLRARCACAERRRRCSSHTWAPRLQLHWRTVSKSNSSPATKDLVLPCKRLQGGIFCFGYRQEMTADNTYLGFCVKRGSTLLRLCVLWGGCSSFCYCSSGVIYRDVQGQRKELKKL